MGLSPYKNWFEMRNVVKKNYKIVHCSKLNIEDWKMQHAANNEEI